MSVSGSAPGLYALDPQAPELALALLMLGVLADDHHAAFAADDLALFADGFHGRLYGLYLSDYGWVLYTYRVSDYG